MRGNPIYAIRGVGCLTYHDEDFIVPSLQLLMQMTTSAPENVPAVRKAALCALSRIGRKYVAFQEVLVPALNQNITDEILSIRWAGTLFKRHFSALFFLVGFPAFIFRYRGPRSPRASAHWIGSNVSDEHSCSWSVEG